MESRRQVPLQSSNQPSEGMRTGQASQENATDQGDTALADRDLLDRALAAQSAWLQDLDTAAFEGRATIEHAGAEATLTTEITLRRSPSAMLTSVELSALSSFLQLLEGDEEYADQPAHGFALHELRTAEGVFAALSGRLLAPLTKSAADLVDFRGQPLFPGWIESRSATEPPGEEDILFVIQALAGINPPVGADATWFADFAQFDRLVGCIEGYGGMVAEQQMEGEPVWVLECPLGEDTSFGEAVAVVTGLATTGSGDGPQLLSLRLRLVINRNSGAPVRHETVWHYRLPDEQDDYVLTGTLVLKEWNQPVKLAEPEPLVDSWWFNSVYAWAQLSAERLNRSFGVNARAPAIPYGLVASWAAAVDELSMRYRSTLVMGGESTVVSTSAHSSRSQRAYESESRFQDGSSSRLLWTQEGFWVSTETQGDDPVWVVSAPGLHGLGELVDEFLSGWSRTNLDLCIPQGALDGEVGEAPAGFGPDARKLRLFGGPPQTDAVAFEVAAERLRELISELLGVEVRIEKILEYTTTIYYRRYTGEPLNLLTEAEFVADGLPASLSITATFEAGGAIKFSEPGGPP